MSLPGARGDGRFATLDLDELRAGLEAKLLPQLACAQAALATLAPGGSITFVTAASARAHIRGPPAHST